MFSLALKINIFFKPGGLATKAWEMQGQESRLCRYHASLFLWEEVLGCVAEGALGLDKNIR